MVFEGKRVFAYVFVNGMFMCCKGILKGSTHLGEHTFWPSVEKLSDDMKKIFPAMYVDWLGRPHENLFPNSTFGYSLWLPERDDEQARTQLIRYLKRKGDDLKRRLDECNKESTVLMKSDICFVKGEA